MTYLTVDLHLSTCKKNCFIEKEAFEAARVIPRFEEQADKVESLGGLEVGVEKGIISVRVQHGSGFSLVGDEIGARKGVIPTFQKIT